MSKESTHYYFSERQFSPKMKLKRIAILGIGGVGGYVGGLLAKIYGQSKDREMIFIARGENAKAIQENGLTIHTDQGREVVVPTIVSDNPAEIGPLDLLICATKSYDLPTALAALGDCISSETYVLPLLNGVDTASVLKTTLPNVQIIDGCIFIVSKLREPGVVEITGSNHSVFFGSSSVDESVLDELEQLFNVAGIKNKRSEDIQKAIWEKYTFIAPLASLTTYLDQTIGQILENEASKKLLVALMQEACDLALKQNITIVPNIIERNLSSMEKMPYETTASMHRDVQSGKESEYKSLNGYVVRLGKELNIPTPEFEKIYREFEIRFNNPK